MPAIGDLLGHKYRVLSKLGSGGMGSVYRAENVLTGKQVALKWMHPEVAWSSDSRERLLREARAGSRLHHPNVVDVYDVVQDQSTLFMVMELLQGETLRAYLSRVPTPDALEFIDLILFAMEGVAAAHDVGVIHRDLKPDNIFLVRASGPHGVQVKVVDFGIAKFTAAYGVTLTDTGKPLGTPLYMSLEQLRGDKDVDVRTDVYAFGVMLYEGLAGRPPYSAETLPELAIKVATTDAPPLRTLRPSLDQGLARLIDSALSRERSRRPENLRVMAAELEAFARKRPSIQRSSAEQSRAARPAALNESSTFDPAPDPVLDTLTAGDVSARRSARSRQRPVVLVGLAAALFVVGGIAYWTQARLNSVAVTPVAPEVMLRPAAAATAAASKPAEPAAATPAPAERAAAMPKPAERAAAIPKPTETAAAASAPAARAAAIPKPTESAAAAPGLAERAAATPKSAQPAATSSKPAERAAALTPTPPPAWPAAPGLARDSQPRQAAAQPQAAEAASRVAKPDATRPTVAHRPAPVPEVRPAPPPKPAAGNAAKTAAEILAF